MTDEINREINDLTQHQEETPINKGLFNLGSIVLLLGVVMAVAVIGMQLVNQNTRQPTGGPAPEFTMTTFDGEQFSLVEQRGNIIVLNFWGSWCGPCRAEAPTLEAIYQAYRDRGVIFLGVTYLDEIEDSLAFINEFNVSYLNGADNQLGIADRYRIEGAPETFVIDQNGDIVRFFYGPIYEGSIDPSELTDLLDSLLAETES